MRTNPFWSNKTMPYGNSNPQKEIREPEIVRKLI